VADLSREGATSVCPSRYDHSRAVTTSFIFFQRHASRLRRRFGIVHTVRRVGESLFKTFRHPTKERFDRSLYFWHDHEQPRLTCASVFRIPMVCFSLDGEHNLQM
jgi:hypothetical protein